MDSIAKPPHRQRYMGTFHNYYSGELKAPILTIVIGGNHEASNYLQELAFGGWLCPNIYYLGNCGVVDVVNDVGIVILTVGGLSGVYSPKSVSQKRYEFPPYNDSSIRSVYHIRNIDKTMLNSMPSGSIDIMLSHDWPMGITKYGNTNDLKDHLKRQGLGLGSRPTMEILKTLVPPYWFGAHFHQEFNAVYEEKTKFMGLDLARSRMLEVGINPGFMKIISYNG